LAPQGQGWTLTPGVNFDPEGECLPLRSPPKNLYLEERKGKQSDFIPG
jgi:hypothetical protein